MTQDDGGQAFPNNDGAGAWVAGMSLRDWFAGQALAGISSYSLTASEFALDEPRRRRVAAVAYALADIMLAERVKETK